MAKTKLAKKRVAQGFENDIAFELGSLLSNGESLTDAIVQMVFDAGMQRYGDKVAAMLRRGGLEIEDGQRVDADMVRALVSRGLDFEVEDLSEDALIDAFNTYAAARLSERLGVSVTSVVDVDVLLQDLQAGAIERFSEGAGGLVSKGMYSRAVRAATWARAGYSGEAKRKIQVSIAQKKYRRSNAWVWG